MKNSLVLTVFVLLLFSTPLLHAREEASPGGIPVSSLPAEAGEITFPFQVSVTAGEWAQAKPGQIFTTGSPPADFVLPSLKEDPVPIRYPRWAVRETWEGTFMIAVEILPTGEVGRWKITHSTGYPLLDQAATEAVRKWRFHAALEQGKPVVSCIQIPIHFELEE